MASNLTTLDLVRNMCGVDTTLVDNTAGQSIIDTSEVQVEAFFNTRFIPFLEFERFVGDSTYRRVLRSRPITRVRAIDIAGTAVSPQYASIDYNAGIISLKRTAETFVFSARDQDVNVITYDRAWREIDESVAPLPITNDEDAGSSVVIEMASTSGLTNGDWVRITGADGFEEIVKITAISANVSITVDLLSMPHAAGSYVFKTIIPRIVTQYATIIASIYFVANVVGSSFDEIVRYVIQGVEVSKGEPYTQWRETAVQLVRLKQEIEMSYGPKPVVG